MFQQYKIMNKITFAKKNIKKGFSLVEMLVAIGIFMTIVTIAVSALISIIGANKRAQAIKNTVDSVNFVVESMSRDLRGGRNYDCLSTKKIDGEIKDCRSGGAGMEYTNSSGNTVIYTFNNSIDSDDILVRETIKNGEKIPPETLISKESGVKLDNMTFFVIGADNEGNGGTQPRVIITASGKIETKDGTGSSFNLQTTVSQRERK